MCGGSIGWSDFWRQKTGTRQEHVGCNPKIIQKCFMTFTSPQGGMSSLNFLKISFLAIVLWCKKKAFCIFSQQTSFFSTFGFFWKWNLNAQGHAHVAMPNLYIFLALNFWKYTWSAGMWLFLKMTKVLNHSTLLGGGEGVSSCFYNAGAHSTCAVEERRKWL